MVFFTLVSLALTHVIHRKFSRTKNDFYNHFCTVYSYFSRANFFFSTVNNQKKKNVLFTGDRPKKKHNDFIRINKNLKINILLTKISFFRLVYAVVTRGACAASFWSMRSEARNMRSEVGACAARLEQAQRGWRMRSEVGAGAARSEHAQRGEKKECKSALPPPRYRY